MKPVEKSSGEIGNLGELATFASSRKLNPRALANAGFRVVSNFEARTMGFKPWSNHCVVLPYFNALKQPVIDLDLPFVRLRQVGISGAGKYLSKGGTHNHAYLSLEVEWVPIFSNNQIPLILTEGELGAFTACSASAAGFPATVGFPGVSSWDGRRQGRPLLAELGNCNFKRRQVFICFDADKDQKQGQYKVEVSRELTHLSARLTGLGAKVAILHLSKTKLWEEGSKLDLEDYITKGGTWGELVATAEARDEGELGQALGEYAYLKSTQKYIDLRDGRTMYKTGLECDTSNRYVGDAKLVTRLLASPKLLRLEGVTVEPSCQALITPDGYYNRWAGFVTQPKPNAELTNKWLRFVKEYFTGNTPDTVADGQVLMPLYLAHMAHTFQHPGKRIKAVWVHQSPEEGIGKSVMIETSARIIGIDESKHQGARILGPNALFEDYPTWADGTIYVACNELSSDHSKHEQMMKAIVTNDRLTVNNKYGLKFEVPNNLVVHLSTNEEFTHKMKYDSRRDIVWTPKWRRTDLEYMAFAKEIGKLSGGDNDFLAAILHYYLEYDLGAFDPNADAPLTTAKARMAENSQSTLELDITALWQELEDMRCGERPGSKAKFEGGIAFFSSFMDVHFPNHKVNWEVTKKRLARHIEKAGFHVWATPYTLLGDDRKNFTKAQYRIWGYGQKPWSDLSAADKRRAIWGL